MLKTYQSLVTYAQGSDQPGQFIESNVIRRTNPYMILKETFKVSGSQATNIGWINVGNGDYRWYVKGEMDTRQRFLDKREMMMLLGENTATAGITVGGKAVGGSEGYFAAIEDRGIVETGGVVNTFTGNPYVITPGNVFFMHMILMDSDNNLAMNLGETYLVTENGNERLGKQKLDLVIL